METKQTKNEQILFSRESINRLDGAKIIFEIVSIETGGRHFYDEETRKRDRLIFIRLSQNGTSIQYPYTVPDLELLWQSMFDVWVKDWKKRTYARRFLKFINKNLLQSNMQNLMKPYIDEK